MRDRDLALECLRLAAGGSDNSPEGVVNAARQYYAFATGEDLANVRAYLDGIKQTVGC